MPSYLGTTANVGTCSACSYWSVASESGSRVEYGGHVWHEMLPTKYVLGRMDMVLGQLETAGRNWTLRASLQRGITKAIVRFPSRVLRDLVLKPKAKIKLQPPSVRSKARDIRRLEWFMRLSSRWIVLLSIHPVLVFIPEYLLCRKLCMTYFVDRLHGLWPYAISTKLCGSALRVTSNILFKYF